MAILTVGRVGVDVELGRPNRWDIDASARRTTERVSGQLHSTSLAATKELRAELAASIGQLVAVTWTDDPSRDGFYLLVGASIDADDYSLNESGLFDFDLTLERLGGESEVEFQSDLTSLVRANGHGLIQSEVVLWHAAPVGAVAYKGGGGVSATIRTGEDGAVPVYTGLATTSDPVWGVPPAGYYLGASRITSGGYRRAGTYTTNTPADFVLGNSILEVRGEASAGASTGRLGIRVHDGTGWGAWTTFEIRYATTTAIPEWHYLTIVRNTPEVCVIRLIRDAEESPPVDSRHTLDLTLRRGAPYVAAYYTYEHATDNPTWSVDRTAVDAATAVTPAGSADVVAIRDDVNDANGNRWILGSSKVTTQDLVNGGIDFTATRTFDFFLGFEIDGSTAAAKNTAESICLQYHGHTEEWVTGVPR